MNQIVQNWWALALRGVLGVIVGLIAFLQPGATLHALVLVFGVFALIDGVLLLIAGVRSVGAQQPRWWWLVLQGIAGVVAGVIAFVAPLATAIALLYLIAFWAILTGVFEIVAALRLRREIENEWMLVLSGAASVLLGVLLLILPGAGLLAWIWMFGAYALVSGVLLIVIALRLRGWGQRTQASAGT